jgi:hypothetical protein
MHECICAQVPTLVGGFPPYVWQAYLFGVVVPLHARSVSPLVYYIASNTLLGSEEPGKF